MIDFLTEIEKSDSEQSVFEALVRQTTKLGFEKANYVYAQRDEAGNARSHNFTNLHPDWIAYYEERGFANDDYGVQHVLDRKLSPIFHDIDRPPEQLDISASAQELWNTVGSLGMKRFLALPFSDITGAGAGGISFGSDSLSSNEFNATLKRDGALIMAMANIAHSRLKARYMSAELLGTILTKRQREVLRCLALGLSNKEIADRLNMKEATVSFHLKATARRLDVRTTREILPRAIALNLVYL